MLAARCRWSDFHDDHPCFACRRVGHPALARLAQEFSQAIRAAGRRGKPVSGLRASPFGGALWCAAGDDQCRFPLYRRRTTGPDRHRSGSDHDRACRPQHRPGNSGRRTRRRRKRPRGGIAGRPLGSRGARCRGFRPCRRTGSARRAGRSHRHLRHHPHPPRNRLWLYGGRRKRRRPLGVEAVCRKARCRECGADDRAGQFPVERRHFPVRRAHDDRGLSHPCARIPGTGAGRIDRGAY